MLKINILISLLGLLIIPFSGCERLLVRPSLENSNTAIFEYVWKATNDSYCCFDIKDVNWDSVYQNYAPMINDDMQEDEFMGILHDMLSELKDGTISLSNATDTMSYKGYYLPYPRNLDVNTIQNFYKSSNDAYAMLGGVAYVNAFLYDECENNFDEIRTMTGKLILDMRNLNRALNSSYEDVGDNENPFRSAYRSIVNNFISNDSTTLGYARYNSELFEQGGIFIQIAQCSDPVIFDEIVVLCNRQTFYEGNKLVYAFTKIPDCTIIGDHTGGGADRVKTILLPNSWSFAIPVGNLIDDDKYISEGFDPDVLVSDDPMTTDKDEIIEKALELLN